MGAPSVEGTRPDESAGRDAQELGRALARLIRAVTRAKGLLHAPEGEVEHAAFPLLVTLSEAGPMRATELAHAVFSDRSTISRQVAHLVDVGYVERRPDQADRRASHLALTAAGARALDACRQVRDAQLAHLTRDWLPADRRALALLVDRLAGELIADLTRSGRDDHPPR
jgi:DNA-binding MarR family transcriptional regulator